METIAINSKEAILKSIKEAVLQIEPEAKVILFGSRARGDEHEESDWDVMILTPYEVDLKGEQRFIHSLFDVELAYEQAISAVVFSKRDWEGRHRVTPLYQNIQQEGVTL